MIIIKIWFYCIKEYCIDLLKFYNLVKVLFFLDLYFDLVFSMLYRGLVMLIGKIKLLSEFCSILNLNRRIVVYIF